MLFAKFKAWLIATKEWLSSNKIFFEIIVSISLTIMAIIVAIQANRISSYQSKIMEAENMPIIEIKSSQSYDEETKFYRDNNIEFTNVGGPVYDFHSKLAVFLEITYSNFDKKYYEQETVSIPITGYYNLSNYTERTKGELLEFLGYKNNLKLIQLSEDIEEYGEGDFSNLEAKVYVQISYKDFLKREHEEYYLIPSIFTEKISDEEGKRIFREFDNAISKDFGSLNKEVLAKVIMEKIK